MGSEWTLARPPPELDLVDESTIAAAAMATDAASAMTAAASLCGLMALSTLTHSASLALPRGSPSMLQHESDDSSTAAPDGGPEGVSPAFEESMFHND